MSSTIIILIAVVLLSAVYLVYGRKVARDVVKLDPARKTPAHTQYDGVDYVPTRFGVLFGHHFASIAGAAPIIGPIVGLAWGWVPCILWVWFGNAFIGAVHDFMALMGSVRHDGRSIQWTAGEVMTPRVSAVMGIFVYICMFLIIAAFAQVLAGAFVGDGTVATASVFFILIALLVGYLLYWRRLNIVWVSVLGVALIVGAIFLAQVIPMELGRSTWYIIFFFYIVIAASLPVTILLQPRDYLNAYLLVALLVIGGIAFVGINASFDWPSFTWFNAAVIGGQPSPFWPTVPLVIACGALSGFHSIVASGTTSKQLDTEAHGLRIGYGGMLTEGFLSSLVIVAMASFALTVTGISPGEVGAEGWEALGIPVFAESWAMGVNRLFGLAVPVGATFAGLAVACFVMTTIDTTNRLGRFALGDLLERVVTSESGRRSGAFRFVTNKWVGSAIGAAIGIYLATAEEVFAAIWAAFGGANQMLAAIALMTSCVWSTQVLRGGKWCRITMIPAFFLWVTVMAAFIWYIVTMAGIVSPLTLVFMGVMAVLALYLFYEVIVALRKPPSEFKG